MAIRIVSLIIVLAAFLGPPSSSQQMPREPKAKCELTPEDYAVYAALVNGLGGPEDPEESWKGKQVFVADVTSGPGDTKSHWGGWGVRSSSKAAPSHDTVADFEREARSSCAMKPESGDAIHYKLITKDELDKTFTEGSWSDFYKKYPDAGGVWTFSRPGYNSARNEAVLSFSHACGAPLRYRSPLFPHEARWPMESSESINALDFIARGKTRFSTVVIRRLHSLTRIEAGRTPSNQDDATP